MMVLSQTIIKHELYPTKDFLQIELIARYKGESANRRTTQRLRQCDICGKRI